MKVRRAFSGDIVFPGYEELSPHPTYHNVRNDDRQECSFFDLASHSTSGSST